MALQVGIVIESVKKVENKKITLIIPVYNMEKYLRKTLDSVLAQTYKELEVIIVDDGSTDASSQICDEYAASDNRFKVFHISNGGLSHARNLGLDNATGDFIGFLDSDDDIEPEMFETLVHIMEENDTDIVGCRYNVLFDDDGPKEKLDTSLPEIEAISQSEAVRRILLKKGCSSVVWDKLYKAVLFRDVRMIEGMIYEDQEVLMRLLAKTRKPFIQINKKLYNYYHRPNSGSITQSAISERRHDLLIARSKMHATVRREFPENEQLARNRYFEAAFQFLYDTRNLPNASTIRRNTKKEIRAFARENSGIKQRKDIVLCMIAMNCCMPFYDLMFAIRRKLKK